MRKFYFFLSSIASIIFFLTFSISATAQHLAEEKCNESLPSNCIASPEPVVVNQSNNTSITIVGKGNINTNWSETIDGYTVVLKNGIYEYAQKVNGKLEASGVFAHDPGNRTTAELNHLSSTAQSIRPDYSPLKSSILSQVNAQIQNKTYPSSGHVRVLALLIDYPDLQATHTVNEFDSILGGSGTGGVHESFKTYYEVSSDSQLTVSVDVMGWFRADSSYIYYGRDSGYARAADLVREAVDAAEIQGVNYANYDNDNNGRVDGILVVHSGQGAEQGAQNQYIWSHRWVMSGGNMGPAFYDGVTINDYIMNPEVTIVSSTPRLVGIGVFAHEFGHNLGLPDLYDTDPSNGDSEGIGIWDVMAAGTWLGIGYAPGDFSAWSKEELGWITPTNLTIGNSGSYNLPPTTQDINNVFRINTNLSNEYFLLENRKMTKLDSLLPGEGMAIWHINTDKTNAPGNQVNADASLKGVDLEEADGLNELDNNQNPGNAGDLYPGTSNNTNFNNTSSPNSNLYTSANSGLEISNISYSGDTIMFNFGPTPGAPCNASTTLTAASGSFDDGSGALNYAHNQSCSWLIQPPSGPISLTFSSFNTQVGVDTLTVYDGTNSSAPLLGRFSGNSIPPTVLSSSNNLYLEFNTDGSISFDGWSASYSSGSSASHCGTDTLTNPTGTFTDGSGMQNYADSLHCSWLIQPSGASVVQLTFDSLATELDNDTVVVYDGNSNGSPVLGVFSGSNLPPLLLSTGNSLFVEFITNDSITDQGFQISYEGVNGCSGITSLTSASGTFSDGTRSNQNYSNNRNCRWIIEPPGANFITLDFNRFRTERNFDFVEVYDGRTTTSPLLGRYSGTSLPQTLQSTGGEVLVRFTSDFSVTNVGWEISYNSTTSHCLQNASLTSNSGTFSDGSGTNNYDDNLNCSWLIQPTSVSTITLSFSAFDTESNNDEVHIYDGTDATGTLLASYSGSSIPSNVTANSGSMFVEFITNDSVSANGWTASYSSTSSLSCSGTTTLTNASGNFDDGSGSSNYDNGLNCNWLIQPSGSPAVISLDFNSMNLANLGDRVRVFDGNSTGGTLIGTFLFTNTGSTVQAYSGSMFVEFVTDNASTGQGWDASYSSSNTYCTPSSTITNIIGTITDGSPNGIDYANNTDCEWLIQPAAANQIVNLNFNRFSTEATNDTVTIYDGSTTSDPVLGTYSGNSIPTVPNSTGGSMLITFKSNGSTTANGWQASYRSLAAPACSGQTTLTAASGTFDDGSGNSNNYVSNSNCSWLIQPPGAVSVNLVFNYFATQANFDFVTIYDGVDNTAPSLGTFSGTTTPSPILSSGGALYLEFTSNNFIEANGWEVSYNSSNTVNLSASPDTVFINAGLGSLNTFNVVSNSSWTTSDNANWLLVTPFNSQSNQTVDVRAIQANIGPQRYAEVYVNSTISAVSDTVIVVQRGSGNYLTATPDSLFYNSLNASGQNINLSSNVNWTAAASDPWISVNPTSGSNNGTPLVNVQNNPGNTIRNGFVVLSGNQGVANDTVFIIQDSTATSAPQLSVSPTSISLAQANGSNDSFMVNSNVVWQTSSGASWLTVNNPTNTSDTNSVQLVANSMNASTNSRSTYVAVQDINSTLFDTVFVTQQGAALILSVSPNNVTLNQTSGSNATISLTSNINWNATVGASWLDISPQSDSGNASLTVSSLSANNLTTPRSSYIALSDPTNTVFDTIFVTQNGVNPQLSLSPATIILSQTANSTDSFTVNSNIDWQALSGAGWLTVVSPSTTSDTNNVTVIANSANTNVSARSTYVAVQDINGLLFDTVQVEQLGLNPILEGSPDTVFLNGMANSNASVQVTSNGSWTATSASTWLTINPTSGSGSSSINVSANSDNNSGSQRRDFLILEDLGNLLRDSVLIVQDTIIQGLTTNPDTIRLGQANASTATFDLNSTISWTSTPDDNWISLSQTNGTGSTPIIVTANSANNSNNDRITRIVSTDNGFVPTSDTVVVIQEGVQPNLTASPSAINLSFTAGSNDVINVTSNLNWTVTNPVTWLSVNPTSGSNDGAVTVTTNSDNLSGASRTASLSFDAPGVAGQTVVVTQIDGSVPTFESSRDTVYVDNPQGSSNTFSILSNVNNWSLRETTPWLLINPQSGSNTSTITVLAASRNVFGNPRSAEITASASGFTDKTITVIQRASTPLFQVAPSNLLIGPDLDDMVSFNISSNLTSWSVLESSSWMEVSPSTGSFTQQIEVTATEENNTGNVRSDLITISAPPLVDQTVLVTQDTIKVTSLEELRLEDQINLFPNPTKGLVNLVVPPNTKKADVFIKVFSFLGKEVQAGSIVKNANNYEINLRGEAEGIYFLQINYKGKLISKKITLIN